MKTFILLMLSLLYLQADSIKSELDIGKILQQIDTISENIRQKQMQETQNMQDHLMIPPTNETSTEHMELENSILKQEQDLQLKEKKLEFLQKEQEYQKRVDTLTQTKLSTIIKRSNLMESMLKDTLYELQIKQKYNINIKQYMKIGNQSYAYLPKQEIESAKDYLNSITKKIKNIKKSLKSLKIAKATNRDKWIQILVNLENSVEDDSQSLQVTVVNSQNNTVNNKMEYIKVKEGDDYENIKISFVSENRVIVVPLIRQ